MSVINKMLRDLDSRQNSASAVNAAQHQERVAIRGTSVSSPSISAPRRRSAWMVPLMVGLVTATSVVGVALWWQLGSVPQSQTQVPKQVSVEPVKPVDEPKSEPIEVPVQAQVPMVVAQAASAVGEVRPTPVPAPVSLPAPTVTTATLAPLASSVPTTAAMPATAPASQQRPATEAPAIAKADIPVKAPVAAPPLSVPPASSSAQAVQRQSAALDALAQSQSLWNAGARDPAVEVLREAISLAQQQGGGVGGNPALIPLIREQARMLVAENRIEQALDLLIRLEPVLAGQADLWAVRGNAAQRLGRHPEAANAYLMALKLRPGEQRWMLGAAISQAIQGNLPEANELAEQARSKGALSAELRAYLRQLGVVVRDN